jgi:two-component system, LytTR family, response regulator
MKLTCAIIDDEPLAVSLLESYVKKTPFLELKGTYNSAVTALGELTREPVELLFLDIQMPELSGMEFSRMLGQDIRIIFTTAFGQYAVDSYKVNALDYLLKPISYPDFLKSANKALQWYELLRGSENSGVAPGTSSGGSAEAGGATGGSSRASSMESIFIKTEYKLVQIELRKILYIEGLKDYVKIYVEDEPKPILSLMSMKTMEDMLPADRFIRVHRSFIVQPEKIKVIERNRIVYGKEYIPISDNYKPKFMEFLAQRSLLP